AKEMGVIEVAFHKKRGLKEEDMVSSPTLYRKLRAFRAGIEANIASLKHNFNLKRCNWKGLARFKAYVWSSILAYNMFTLIRAG
ncbi:MAG: transposase, partial [Acidobacteria bacterium]|nr:transposase [Acidobacteriota bacterium]